MDDFGTIFAALRSLFSKHEARCVVLHDGGERYYLGTHEVREKDGYRTGFGGVEIKKGYVAAHLIPIYVHSDLLENVSDRLRRRMHGKSCFNFRNIDYALFEELGALVDRGIARFCEDGPVPNL